MIVLPEKSKTKELAGAIDELTEAGLRMRNKRLCEWLVSRAFLAGVRTFNAVDYQSGEVTYTYENQYNDLDFRNEELLRDYQIEMGRFLGIDIRPSVQMLGWGLDRLRAASIGQVVLDYQVDEPTLARIRVPFIEQLLQMGPSIVHAGVREAGALSGRSIIEVGKPWEYLPIPHNAQSPQQALGFMRVRSMPLAWLKRRTDLWDKLKRYSDKELEIREVDWSQIEAENSGDLDSASSGVVDQISGAFTKAFQAAFGTEDEGYQKYKEGRQVVRAVEYWTKTDMGLVRRYGCKIGKVVVEDEDFEKDDRSVWMPIGIARYYSVGFYGRGFVEPLRPFVIEAEKNLKAFWRMLRDLDAMGLLMIPTDLGIDDESFRMDESPRRCYYKVDPLATDRQVTQIRPFDLGSLPQQGMNVSSQYITKLSGQSPIFQGQSIGRVDSQAGMGLALETNNVGIEAPGSSIADAFTTVYASILGASKAKLTQQLALPILSLDTNVVGVVMGPDGTMDLSDNPSPSPSEVKINIKSRTPPSPAQQLTDLRGNLQMGLISPMQFRLTVYRKGLPTDVSNEAEFQSWRKIRLNIRRLFNDGKTPNTDLIAADRMSDNVDVCLEELAAFMASPEYSLSAPEVKEAFIAFRDTYEQMRGVYPPQMPYPEEIAAMAQQQGTTPQQAM